MPPRLLGPTRPHARHGVVPSVTPVAPQTPVWSAQSSRTCDGSHPRKSPRFCGVSGARGCVSRRRVRSACMRRRCCFDQRARAASTNQLGASALRAWASAEETAAVARESAAEFRQSECWTARGAGRAGGSSVWENTHTMAIHQPRSASARSHVQMSETERSSWSRGPRSRA